MLLVIAFDKKVRTFKVPKSWELMDLAWFIDGLNLRSFNWSADQNDKVASSNRAKKIMMMYAQDLILHPSASF